MQVQGRTLDAAREADTLARVQRIWNWPGLKMHHKGLFVWLADRREGATLPALVPITIPQICLGLDATPRTVERWLKDLVDAGLLRVFERAGDGGTVWQVNDPADLRRSRVVEDRSGSRPLFEKHSDPHAAPPALKVAGPLRAEGATNLTSNLSSEMTSELAPAAGSPSAWPSLREEFSRKRGAPPDLTTNLTSNLSPPVAAGRGFPHALAGARATKDQETKSKSPIHQEPNLSKNQTLRHHPTARNVGPATFETLAAAAVADVLDKSWPQRQREAEEFAGEIGDTIGETWLIGEFRAALLEGVLSPGLLREALDQFADWRRRGGRPTNLATSFRGIVERLSYRDFRTMGSWRKAAFPNGSHPQRE